MAIHLLADVHLIGDDDPNAQRLIRYLDGPARAAEAVYVLGDLFDVWVGDDGSLPAHAQVIDRFAALARSGVPVYFMRGNRDFAVGEAFVAASHMQILEDPIVIDLYGTPTLLSHGDIFCTDDTAHQKFRARYTDPRWRARMLKLPLWLRRHIARRARKRSMRGKATKPAHIMDVNAETVRRAMQRHGVARLIHGHTHRPDTHYLEIDGQQRERIVLADWRPSCAQILVVGADGIERQDIRSRA